jgi:hypothetical protein
VEEQPVGKNDNFTDLVVASAKSSARISFLLAGFTAIWAAHGFILQAFFLIKGLFAFCKDEFFVAVFAT